MKQAISTMNFGGVLVVAALMAGCAKDSPDVSLASAKGYLAKNEPTAAVIELRNALQQDPDVGEARFLLGKTLWSVQKRNCVRLRA